MENIIFIGKKTNSISNTLSGLGYDVHYLEMVSAPEDIVKFIVANADNAFAIIYDLSEFTFCVNAETFGEIISSVSKMAVSTIQVVKGIPSNYKAYYSIAETYGIYNFLKSITTDDLIEEIKRIFPDKKPCQTAPVQAPIQTTVQKQPQLEIKQENNMEIPKNYMRTENTDGEAPTEELSQKKQYENIPENILNFAKAQENNIPNSYNSEFQQSDVPQNTQPVQPSKKELKEIKKQQKLREKEEKRKNKFEAKRQAVNTQIQPEAIPQQVQPQPIQQPIPQQIQPQPAQQPRPTKITTIGVIGIMPRIGTTTQAIMLTRYLNEAGIRACYVEENNTQFCDCLMSLYDDVSYDSDRDCLVKENLTLYKEETRSFINNNVAYRIVDYGYITESGFPENYLKKDIKIVVCGTAPLEIANLISNVEMMYDKDLNYIFALSDEQHYNEILDVMGTKKDKCYLSPYISDSFDFFTQPCRYIYNSILNLNIPSGVKPEEKKKKRWRK